MTLFACGTCGISLLSNVLPPLTYWIQLLPIAFLAYHYIEWREGEFAMSKLVTRLGLAVVAFMAGVAFLAFIIAPIVFLCVFIAFLAKLASNDRKVKATAAFVLAAYAVTGGLTYYQAKTQGPYWRLTRLQAGSPGQRYFQETAVKSVFTREELLSYLSSDNPTVRQNTAEVVERLAGLETDRQEAESFRRSLQAVDPLVADEYAKNLRFAKPKTKKAAPSPSPTP
ncbi:MAG: hypothetical protein KC800_17865 [Candidatus Eremiobacteraeota bacterium]|nr:hypothetical protein [Candidatus Eremiobacteraeota bacterium]